MLLFKSIICIFIILISAQAQADNYTAHKDKPTATMRLSSAASPVFVDVYQDRDCKSHKNGTRLASIDDTFDPVAIKGKVIETEINSGENITINFLYRSWSMIETVICPYTFSFIPADDTTYHAHFLYKNNLCKVQLIKYIDDESKWEIDTTFSTGKLCIDESTRRELRTFGR